ncbi:hypothetical protein V2J09_006264 [Rumex salicifolius]
MNTRHCIVIGGEGCIGRSLVLRLLKLGNWIVRIADSSPSLSHQNSLISTALNEGRASYFQIDVHNKSQVIRAVQSTYIVFYIGSSESYLGDYYHSYIHIVQGVKNVINACLECNVERLIYNCTSDVVFDGFQDIISGDESLQYPWKYLDMLNDLRSQAESLVLSANKPNGLLTCSIRPSNVFGPSDTYLVPSLIKQANSSLTKFILGNGDNKCDFTYVENIAHSHICAAEAQAVVVGGKAFFITNLEPMYYWEFVSQIYKGLGYQRPIIKLPAWILTYILMSLKWLRDQLESEYSTELLLTQLFIQSALFTKTFSCIAAEERLGYSPIVSLDEGLALTLKSYSHSSKEKYPTKYIHLTKETKAENLLNNGKVADILLWRDETDSLGFTIQRVCWSYTQISNSRLRATILKMAFVWNKGLNDSRELAQGKNWNIFLKALIRLYVLKLIFSISSCTLLGLAMIFSFTSFFTYEQYEARIDELVRIVTILYCLYA